MKRFLATWILPPAVFCGLYWLGLWVWFHTDDFTLLWLAQLPPDEFWPKLLEPRAQGTFRPLSERLFFYLFYNWFGLDAFPYRVLVFATQIANITVLTSLAWKVSGSRTIGASAAALWGLHHGLAVTMSWSSAYNQALCSLFILASLRIFIAFAESGRVWLYVLQWLTFLAGFGALESVVVYPALALGWCLLFRRDRIWWAAAMLAGSGALAWLQLSAPAQARTGLYALSWEPATLLQTLGYYLHNALAARQAVAVALALGLPLAAAAIWEASRGRFTALFGWGWFLVTVAPFLPLSNHLSDYYLFLPSAGLALAVAAVLAQSRQHDWRARAPALVLAAGWVFCTATYAADVVRFNLTRSMRARNLVGGLVHARRQHPNKTLLLAGVDEDFFYSSIYHDVLRISGLFDVYLAPDRNSIRERAGAGPIERFFVTKQEAALGIRRNSIVVYDASGMRLREITRQYHELAPLRLGE